MGNVSGGSSGNLELLKRIEELEEKIYRLESYVKEDDVITMNDVLMYRYPITDSRNNNADNFVKSGYYFTSTETENASVYGIILVISVPAPWIFQLWFRYDGTIFVRNYMNVTESKWSEWRKITTETL